MAYTQVVEALGEHLASFLELSKKWLGWFGSFKPLLDCFHQLRKEDLMGLTGGTHKIVYVGKGDVVLSAEVDFDAQPELKASTIGLEEVRVTNKCKVAGKTLVEKRKDGLLYVNGKKVILHLPLVHRNSQVGADAAQKAVETKVVLSACLMDFLASNQEFIPDGWRSDGRDYPTVIFFWGSLYQEWNKRLGWCDYVPHLHFKDGKWEKGYSGTFGYWNSLMPAAILED